ncbi:MAG: SprB repeat-containing protein, partial [Vicingaceae bacterium]
MTIDSLTTTAPSGPYSIRINTNPVQFFNVGDTIPLGDGNYTITVFDLGDSNTPTFRSFSIDEPFQLVTALISTSASCFGACDGEATAFAFDGTPGYSYLWSTSDTTQTIDSLCAGTYYITVTDANNCTAVDSVVVNEPSFIQPNVSVTDVDCFGNSTGSATANPSGGTGVYVDYQWSSSGNNTATEGNLSAGTYTVTVTDDDGCTGVDTFIVNQPSAPLSVSITNDDVDCFGDSTAFARAQSSGGPSPYTYQWDDYANQTTAQ